MKSAVIDMNTFYLVFTGLKTRSQNSKTGKAVQTYLIDKERLSEPKVFGSKCSACPMVEKCYVKRDKQSVRKALKKMLGLIEGNTSYQLTTLDQVLPLLEGRKIRLGTYGDPSALSIETLVKITSAATLGHLGYTHFWREISPDYARFLMASCESAEDEREARLIGYRRFRVRLLSGDQHLLSDSIECPNVTHGITCDQCGLCDGTRAGSVKSIWIGEHGNGIRRN